MEIETQSMEAEMQKILKELKGKRGNKNFNEDNDEIGLLGERLMELLLLSKGFCNIKFNPKGKRVDMAKWDIEAWYEGVRYTFEVKTDARAAETGNLCIEHSKLNKEETQIFLSGISVTTADFFVSIIPDRSEVRIIYTSVLRGVIEREKNNLKTVKMGDGLRTRGYLMKMSKYEKHYRAIHRL
jgi:hypothetical protein